MKKFNLISVEFILFFCFSFACCKYETIILGHRFESSSDLEIGRELKSLVKETIVKIHEEYFKLKEFCDKLKHFH